MAEDAETTPVRSESDNGSGGQQHSEQREGGGGLKSYFRVFKYADGLSWTLNGGAFLAAIAAGTLLPLMDLIFGKFVTTFTNFAIGTLSPATFRSEINKYTLYFIYLFVAKFSLTYIHTIAISVSAIRTTKALRIDFLQATLRQNIAFFDSADAGSTSVQVTTNGNLVSQGISEKLTLTVQGLSTFISAFVVAFAVQWKLALITVSIVPTILIVTSICVVIDTKQEAQILPIYSKAGLLAEEVFSSMRTVHAFWLQPTLSKRYDALLGDAMKVGMKKSPNYAVLFSTEFFCVFSGYGLAFWQGIRMYASGEIAESGDVVTVIFAVIVAATAMTSIAPQILQVTKASSAAEELFRTIDRPSEIDAMSETGKVPDASIGNIEARDVHFAYPIRPGVKVLEGLTLSIPARKTTALVGASGSGKSTIIGLLERWYDPAKGSLYLDGVDLKDLNVRWLRTNIRLVQQEPVLFNGTVFDNVAFGLLGTDKAGLPAAEQILLVQRACKAAYADEFIEHLPKKYDTQIGERAMMLSGGQKQRLAIARSIISDPKVLLLDEATSALDPKSERIVQQALDNVSTDRTTVVIAHKLSTVRNADNIAVMSQGTIIEQGTHDELIAAGGAYARLVMAQDLGHADGDQERDSEKEEVDRRLSLIRTQTGTRSINVAEKPTAGKEGSLNYSLIRCLWILLGEQKHLWHLFLIVAIACVFGGLTFPAQAILFSRTMNAFQLQGPEGVRQGDFYSLMFFVVALANLVVYAAVGWVSNIIAQVVIRVYRLEMFDNALRQDMDFFDREENATGALASRLSTYPTNLQELLGFNVMLILINVVNVLSSSVLALIVGWKLGLVVVFGALPPMLFCGYLRIRLEFKLDDATAERFASSAALATEAVSAIRTVASLTLEKHILERYHDKLRGVARRSMKALIWTMFWYGGRLISTGEYSTSQFFIVFIGVIFSGEAAAAFFSYTTSITKAQSAANHILWFRTLIPSIREDQSQSPPGEKDSDSGRGPAHVECEDLEFSYASRPNTKVLQGVNIDVKAGAFAALVGPSGCGKSTMIALLERFYDPTSGCIRFDGTDIKDLCPRRYRRNVALVQQEPVLYQGSIRDNVAMGLATEAEGAVSDEKVEEACKQANIYEFVSSLPDGFSTLCGSRGTQLSGGQRQRVAIARALIRAPRLLLLDEATSALDTESEKVVQAALEKAQSGRTTVAVAHRLSTVKDADVIMVFSKGRIVESGTHVQLLAKRGVYYEMCLGQSLDRDPV